MHSCRYSRIFTDDDDSLVDVTVRGNFEIRR
ncbi:MAG: hypothetical protein ACI9UN_002092, partial [Granulosicoccus sp.]